MERTDDDKVESLPGDILESCQSNIRVVGGTLHSLMSVVCAISGDKIVDRGESPSGAVPIH